MEQKEITLKEKYKNSAQKLFDLCEYIQSKVAILKALNITFSDEQELFLEAVKAAKIKMKECIETINNDEQHFDQFDLDYEIYQTTCSICRSDLKIIEFAKNELDHDFNVYKCVNCGVETQDELPNRIEHVKIYFEYQYKIFDLYLNDKAVKKESRKEILALKAEMVEQEQLCISTNDEVIRTRNESRDAILDLIKAYDDIYDEMYLNKHTFDPDITEA